MATELETRTCPRCGSEVPSGAHFCPTCGAPLGEQARSERRIVTVLFADLTGFTEMSERLDAEEVKAIVDRAFEGLAELVTLYGGRVDKIIGDEIMAVFGAPQAHEDDPERAVRCALEMNRQLLAYSDQLERDRSVKLGMRIGVNTGEVVAGRVGGVDAYSVIGDAVNATKRIESAAHAGEVLVGERTYLSTSGAIEYREHEPIVAKGKSEPVAVWEAIAERALPGEHFHRVEAPIIGRDEERAMLESLADIVRRDRKAAVVTLLGAAGMGKSRLAEDFATRITGPGVSVISGRSLPYGSASPSFAVEEMVRSALDVEAGDQQEAARARAANRLAALGLVGDADRLLTLAGLREAMGRDAAVGGGPAAAGGRPAATRGSDSLQAARGLFTTMAEHSELLVLIFHELHWADDPLLDFVGDLIERGREMPMLVLCVARPELLERQISWTGRPGSLVHVLEPLPRDRAAQLLDALAGSRGIHPAVRESILERAGGNPFFLEELARLLFDEGGLPPSSDTAELADTVPGTVQALVTARLDALPALAKRVAQTAAVIGDEFWTGALHRLEPTQDKSQIESAVDQLVERGMVEPVAKPSLPNERAFRFRQALVREVAYGSVPKEARAKNHAALGEWLEEISRGSDFEGDVADLVAHHFERAARLASEVGLDLPEAREKAREYLERAGDQAISLDAAAAAADFFQRALEFARGETDRMQLQLHLGEALVGCWRPIEAERHLFDALEGARRSGERRSEAKALRLLGDLYRIRGEIDEGRILLDQALTIARDVGDPIEEAEGLRSHGLADLFQGKLEGAPIWFRQSLERYRELGDKRGQGWSLVNLGWVDLLLGRLDEASALLEEGLGVFTEIGDTEGAGWCLGLRAWVLLFEGKLSEAEALQTQIESLMIQGSRPVPRGMGGFGWAIGRVLMAFIAQDRAQLEAAENHAQQALIIFEESDAAWGLAMARFPLGTIQCMRLELDAARETFREAISAAERSGDPMVRALVTFGAGLVEYTSGNLDEADRLGEEAQALTTGTGVSWISEVPSRSLKAKITADRGQVAEGVRILEDLAKLPAGLYDETRAVAILADLLCEAGRVEDAIEVARRGVSESDEDVVGRAQCLRSLGRAQLLAEDPEDAEKTLREHQALLAGSDWNDEKIRALVVLTAVLDQLGRHDEAGIAIDEARALLRRFPPGADTRSLEALFAG